MIWAQMITDGIHISYDVPPSIPKSYSYISPVTSCNKTTDTQSKETKRVDTSDRSGTLPPEKITVPIRWIQSLAPTQFPGGMFVFPSATNVLTMCKKVMTYLSYHEDDHQYFGLKRDVDSRPYVHMYVSVIEF